jgi:hypothetical protein
MRSPISITYNSDWRRSPPTPIVHPIPPTEALTLVDPTPLQNSSDPIVPDSPISIAIQDRLSQSPRLRYLNKLPIPDQKSVSKCQSPRTSLSKRVNPPHHPSRHPLLQLPTPSTRQLPKLLLNAKNPCSRCSVQKASQCTYITILKLILPI